MRHYFTLVLVLGLTGCTVLSKSTDRENREQLTGVDRHSSFPAVRRNAFELVNILEMVDPKREAEKEYKNAWGDTLVKDAQGTEQIRRTADGDSSISYGARYDLALSWFRDTKDITSDEKKNRRNAIQERILSVSTSRCNVFKTYLRRDQANTNYLLGSLTTVSAVLGAVLQGANASRNLAGTAGIFSGIRSEYNQAYYSNLAAHVIAKGIEVRQEAVYKRIQTEGQSKGIEVYPLEAAIKDAIYFDGLCSVVAGLDQAAASIDATREPSIDAAMRTVLRARLLQEAASVPLGKMTTEDLDKLTATGSRLGMSLVGSARSEPAPPGIDIDLFAATEDMIGRLDKRAEAAAKELDTEAMAHKKTIVDKITDQAAAKKLADAAPTAGDLAKKYKEAINKGIFETLGLNTNQCFVKYAAPALKDRSAATDALAKAGKDTALMEDANHLLKLAARRVQDAHDHLRRVERLAAADVERAKTVVRGEIAKVTGQKDQQDWKPLENTAVVVIKPQTVDKDSCK